MCVRGHCCFRVIWASASVINALAFFANPMPRVSLRSLPVDTSSGRRYGTNFLPVIQQTNHRRLQNNGVRMKRQSKLCNDDNDPRVKDGNISNVVRAIASIRSGGDFCVAGKANFPLPGLTIIDVGQIAFPLLQDQANAIKKVATQAPYGKGSETLVDTAVRNTLQIEPSKVSFSNPEWSSALQDLVREVSHRMGLASDFVQADLYKILLYEPGGHFKPHQDTEKAEGMFGTLIVQFPCDYEGGQYTVRHSGINRAFTLGGDDGMCRQSHYFVAHYADCEHEVQTVTRGNRLVAVYSLSWKAGGTLPSPPLMEPAIQLARGLRHVENKCYGVLLKHEYTESSIRKYGIRCLKGIDRAIAGSLMVASSLMQEQDPKDELILNIAEVRRITSPHYDGQDACIQFDYVYDELGKLQNRKETKMLSTFEFDSDVLNYRETDGERVDTLGVKEGTSEEFANGYYQNYGRTMRFKYQNRDFYEDINSFDYQLEQELEAEAEATPTPVEFFNKKIIKYINIISGDNQEAPWYDLVWWTSRGCVGYQGNYGSDEDYQYSAYVLTFYRRAALSSGMSGEKPSTVPSGSL